MSQKRVIIKRKYLCIFCRKRICTDNSIYNNGCVGICPDCISKLNITPHPPLFAPEGDIDYVVSPFFYDSRIRELIIDLKFNNSSAFAEVLSHLMCIFLNDMHHLSDFDCVVPVPLSKKRFLERGYNQAQLLAKPFAEFFRLPLYEDMLFKIKETKRQSRVDISERYTNVQGAFKASDKAKDKRILLFDDILTTGGTLAACSGALKLAGAKNIVGVTLSVTKRHENILNIMY